MSSLFRYTTNNCTIVFVADTLTAGCSLQAQASDVI